MSELVHRLTSERDVTYNRDGSHFRGKGTFIEYKGDDCWSERIGRRYLIHHGVDYRQPANLHICYLVQLHHGFRWRLLAKIKRND